MKWKIKDNVYIFPDSWNKQRVINFANQDFKICPYCGHIDVLLQHLNDCTSSHEQEELKNDQFYK